MHVLSQGFPGVSCRRQFPSGTDTIIYFFYIYYYPSSTRLQSYAQAQSSALDYVFISFFAHLLLITFCTDLVL